MQLFESLPNEEHQPFLPEDDIDGNRQSENDRERPAQEGRQGSCKYGQRQALV